MLRRILIAAVLIGLSCSWIEAQRPVSTPIRGPESPQQRINRSQREQADELTYDELKRQGKDVKKDAPPSLDKATIERIKQFRAVDPELVKANSAFLKIPGTGITKFLPNNGCQSAAVVNASEKCRDFIPE